MTAAAATTPATPTDLHRHAHWFFLLSLGAIVAGFWPSFFQPLGARDAWHTLHGVTATLWVVALVTQSFVMSRGQVRRHRAVAFVALPLLAVLCVSALYMVAAMQRNAGMPPFLPPLLGFIDVVTIAFLLILVGLALGNLRRPAVHKRCMSATVFLVYPPALTRLYARVFAPEMGFTAALHASFLTADLVLLALILQERRTQQRYLPYPLTLAFFVMVQALMRPVGSSAWWQAFMTWYGRLPMFGG